ncbi:hypothetical protein FGO68_gene8644 [Halteria grandinella]|uniref:Uncharacterized protein n=1 Tax=Halteria grandinella TaxID=5974 RepID=A0A8J8T793_HALGN|nr:hypothetical protein FGO68_gene8644 [Halteria grandinella]
MGDSFDDMREFFQFQGFTHFLFYIQSSTYNLIRKLQNTQCIVVNVTALGFTQIILGRIGLSLQLRRFSEQRYNAFQMIHQKVFNEDFYQYVTKPLSGIKTISDEDIWKFTVECACGHIYYSHEN